MVALSQKIFASWQCQITLPGVKLLVFPKKLGSYFWSGCLDEICHSFFLCFFVFFQEVWDIEIVSKIKLWVEVDSGWALEPRKTISNKKRLWFPYHQTFTCTKLTIEMICNMFKINTKYTRTNSLMSFWSLCYFKQTPHIVLMFLLLTFND